MKAFYFPAAEIRSMHGRRQVAAPSLQMPEATR
jgi:hypothetical protein